MNAQPFSIFIFLKLSFFCLKMSLQGSNRFWHHSVAWKLFVWSDWCICINFKIFNFKIFWARYQRCHVTNAGLCTCADCTEVASANQWWSANHISRWPPWHHWADGLTLFRHSRLTHVRKKEPPFDASADTSILWLFSLIYVGECHSRHFNSQAHHSVESFARAASRLRVAHRCF